MKLTQDKKIIIPIIKFDHKGVPAKIQLMTILYTIKDKKKDRYKKNKDNRLNYKFGLAEDCNSAEKFVYNYISHCCDTTKLQDKLSRLEIDTEFESEVDSGKSYQFGLYLSKIIYLLSDVKYNNIVATGTVPKSTETKDGYDHYLIGAVNDLEYKLENLKPYIENEKIQAIYIPFYNGEGKQDEQDKNPRIDKLIEDIKEFKVEGKNVEVHRVRTLTDALITLNINKDKISSEEKHLKTSHKKFINWLHRIKKYLSSIGLIKLSIAIIIIINISIYTYIKNKKESVEFEPDKNKQLEIYKQTAINNLTCGCLKIYKYKNQQCGNSRAIDDLDEALFLFLYLDFKKVPEADGYIALADYFLKQSYNHAKDSDMFKATEEAFKSQLNKLSPQEEEKIKSNFKKNADCNKINNFFKNPHDM